MNTLRTSLVAWLLALTTSAMAFLVWLPSVRTSPTAYDISAVLGLVAFGIMWGHYVIGAIRRYRGETRSSLMTYHHLSGYIVLLCILLHPAVFYSALYRDGLGAPPQSFLSVYTEAPERIAVFMGTAALLVFLLFELNRWHSKKLWWRYVEWANVAAMGLIIWHGFTLGGELGSDWFRVLWALYAVSFVGAIVYNHQYDNQKG